MKISELIKELEKIKEKEGDIEVFVREYIDDNDSYCGGDAPLLTIKEGDYEYSRSREKQVVL